MSWRVRKYILDQHEQGLIRKYIIIIINKERHMYMEAEVKRGEAASLPRGWGHPGRGEKARPVEGRRRVPGQERMEYGSGPARSGMSQLYFPVFVSGCISQCAGPRFYSPGWPALRGRSQV
jgi:hypothetical protein